MLSRVAKSLYWMVRDIERADNLARLIEVNEHLVPDLGKIDSTTLAALWRPVIASTGDDELFDKYHPDGSQSEAIDFLTVDRENPNSIASCIANARENARMVRDQLSEALWEKLNGLYLFLNSNAGARMLATDASTYYEQIRRATHAFHGIAAATTLRGEAWDFMDLGRHLERADKTTRFLDITTYLERRIDEFGLTVNEHWMAILRSCGGLGAFRLKYGAKFTPRNIAEFLIFSSDFPRSVRFCVDRVDQSLHAISGTDRGGFSNGAEMLSGRLLSALADASAEEVLEGGFHHYLDDLQSRLNEIGEEVFSTYGLIPEQIQDRPPIPAGQGSSVVRWQMEQQQQ